MPGSLVIKCGQASRKTILNPGPPRQPHGDRGKGHQRWQWWVTGAGGTNISPYLEVLLPNVYTLTTLGSHGMLGLPMCQRGHYVVIQQNVGIYMTTWGVWWNSRESHLPKGHPSTTNSTIINTKSPPPLHPVKWFTGRLVPINLAKVSYDKQNAKFSTWLNPSSKICTINHLAGRGGGMIRVNALSRLYKNFFFFTNQL